MNFLAVDLALYERLVGAPLSSRGTPKTDARGIPVNRLLLAPPGAPMTRTPSYGVRVPVLRQGVGASKDATRALRPNKDFVFNTHQQIPVFPVNIESREWPTVWPSVTFYWYDLLFNPSTYTYADQFCEPADGTPELEVTNRNGEVIASGPREQTFRAHPEPYDATYVIRTFSKSFAETKWMSKAILDLFPARGVLEVEQADGSKLALDMSLDRVENLDEMGQNVAMSAEGEQRFFSRGFIYTVEGYADNTGGFNALECGRGGGGPNGSWTERSITDRILELADMQNNLLATCDIDDIEANPP